MIPEPYENVYIGAFVFALGYAAREKNMRPTDTYTQLLQQTPGDRPLGDLLTSWGGRSFIFEFKRRETGLQSERKKCYCCKNCPEDCDEHRNLFFDRIFDYNHKEFHALSERCHFAAFGETSGNKPEGKLLFMPYLKITENAKQNSIQTNLNKFASDMMHKKELGLNHVDFKKYYQFLIDCSQVNPDGSIGQITGAFVNIGENGELRTIALSQLADLSNNFRMEDNVHEREPYEQPAPVHRP